MHQRTRSWSPILNEFSQAALAGGVLPSRGQCLDCPRLAYLVGKQMDLRSTHSVVRKRQTGSGHRQRTASMVQPIRAQGDHGIGAYEPK